MFLVNLLSSEYIQKETKKGIKKNSKLAKFSFLNSDSRKKANKIEQMEFNMNLIILDSIFIYLILSLFCYM